MNSGKCLLSHARIARMLTRMLTMSVYEGHWPGLYVEGWPSSTRNLHDIVLLEKHMCFAPVDLPHTGSP